MTAESLVGVGRSGEFTPETFTTSRELDFCTEKELTAQTGYCREDWPVYAVHELFDNALDACEESGTSPEIVLIINEAVLEVRDNGPGIPPATVERVLDFDARVSSREVYVWPCRGAQGNALKTLVMMPFVLDGQAGQVEVIAVGGIIGSGSA
jgi:DNA topoisomerase VI subunit B